MTKEIQTSQNAGVPAPRLNDTRCLLSGSVHPGVAQALISQLTGSLYLESGNAADVEHKVEAAVMQAMGVKPRDELEGMMAAQMVTCHNAAMECFRRAAIEDRSAEVRNMELSQANKLLRTYATMLESLGRHRGKGQQKVTVEHVHVHAGGQAIVGQITPSGGGGRTKTEEQPYAVPRQNP